MDFDCPRILGEKTRKKLWKSSMRHPNFGRKPQILKIRGLRLENQMRIILRDILTSDLESARTVSYKIHKAKSKPNFDKKIGIQVFEEELVEMIIEFLNEVVGVPSSKLEEFIREKVLKNEIGL